MKNKVPRTPASLDLGSPVLTTTGESVNAPLHRTVSFAKKLKRLNSGVPSSFVREVNEHFASHTSASDSDRGVDESYARESVIAPGLSRIDKKNNNTKSLDLDSIRAGPYSTSTTSSGSNHSPKSTSRAELDEIEKCVERMLERHRVHRWRDVAVYLYAVITSVVAVAALVVAAVAICQVRGVRRAEGTVVVLGGVVLDVAPHHSSLLRMGGLAGEGEGAGASTLASSMSLAGMVNSTRSESRLGNGALSPKTQTHLRLHSTTALSLLGRNADNVSPSSAPPIPSLAITGTTTKTTTQTLPITLSTPHPTILLIPSPPQANIAARRYVAPLSWENLKRRVAKIDDKSAMVSSTRVTGTGRGSMETGMPFAEKIVQRAYGNGGERRRRTVWGGG